jgi:hypothetical protein
MTDDEKQKAARGGWNSRHCGPCRRGLRFTIVDRLSKFPPKPTNPERDLQ